MISAEALDLFRRLCEGAEQLILCTHIHPDGDAIGSEISLARFLISRGKQVRILNHDRTSNSLGFLENPSLAVEIYDAKNSGRTLREADLVVLLDNSVPDRLGRMESEMVSIADRVLCIDHHPARNAPWKHNIVDEGAAATTEMIYELTLACGFEVDPATAEAIFVGLATDTGFFRFNSTTARCYEIAAAMVRIGVDPARTYGSIYERNSLAFTRLLGHALTDLHLDAGGAVATVQITRDLINKLEAGDVDTSEITTSLLAIDGVRVAILFRELAQGGVKVSLRSKGDLDVHRLATEFGGGGHRNASGIVMEEPLDRAVKSVSDRTASLLAPGHSPG